ncbi:MAG: trypsin-like peptidase domain-containing protein [Planctomycetes bacterium]|nr:trypsin-like peptidase domain-containing protein [Planctomycetota bacterium]
MRPQLFVAATVRILMMNAGIAIFLGIAAIGQDADRAAVLAEEQARIEVIRRVTPSVVCLFAKEAGAGGGSGVLIDSDGYGLTNFHVVASMLKDRVGEAGLANGKRVEMQVLGIDPHGDVAMFRLLSGGPFTPAVFGDADSLQVGDSCLALGNPFLLAEDYTPTVTFGIVSGLHRYQWGTGRALSYTDCIQVDTSINPGNSGGPLFDMEGRLVGINGRVSIEERGRVNVGVGYAITINQIRRFIPGLRAGLTTPHGAAGFTVADASRKIVVNQILKDSAAHRAGLRVGDHLTRFGGVPLRSANHFLSQLGTYPAGWLVDMVYEREGQTLRTAFRLDTLPLPETRRRPGSKAPDPFAPNKLTRGANRRAMKRLFELVAKANGGREALKAFGAIHMAGVRRPTDKPQDSGTAIDVTERRADALRQSESAEQMERRIRWTLWRDAADPDAVRGTIIGSDEAGGRAAAVMRREFGEVEEDNETTTQPSVETKSGYRLWLDDADGRLLAMEFADPVTGKLIRVEYADEKRCGPLKLSCRRTVFEDGRAVYDEIFEKVEVSEAAR